MKNNSLKNLKIETHLVSCDFCGHDKYFPLYDKMRHGLNLPTVICSNCCLCYTNPQPTPNTLSEFYSNYYHLFHGRYSGVDKNYLNKSRRFAKRRFETLINVEKNIDQKKILEIGSGAGQFIKKLAEVGVDAVGIEPGKQSFNYCKSEKINILNVSIEEFNPKEKFDIISSFHVIEHVKSPKSFLKRCYDLLNMNGLIYLEVPNLYKPIGPYSDFFQFPHLFSFSYITLTNYYRSTGFEPIFIKDELHNLTIICRKMSPTSNNFCIKIDPHHLRERIKFVEKIRRLAHSIPKLPYLRKLKAILIEISI